MNKSQRDETLPEWLNESFIENALKKGFRNPDLKILKSEIKMATSVGENFASLMLRAIMTIQTKSGSEENLSVIIKVSHPGSIGEELRKFKAFQKEEEALSKTLPAANELLVKAYPGHESLWATCYHYQRTPDDVIFLQDLRPLGFILADRMKGLDMDHTLLVLRSLAKLHASSLPVIEREDPKNLEVYLNSFWSSKDVDWVSRPVQAAFGAYPEVVSTWLEFDRRQIYAEKFKRLQNNLMDRLYDGYKRDDSNINVLLHGDTWVNNFLFRYDSTGKPTAIKLVDFQFVNLNNPALDLHHLIYSSVEPQFKFDTEALDLFLKTYHETFQETLDRLQYPIKEPYTLDRLRRDFEDRMFWGFIVFCTIYPMTVLPKEDVFPADDFFDENSCFSLGNVYRRKELKDVLKKGFQFFEEKGVF